jgi:hypothetical protein
MPEEFEIQKLKNEYPEFFEQLSSEFLDFIFSEETSFKIAKICFENGIEDSEKVEKIAYRVTLALLDQVPKENLAEIFEKGVGLNREIAERISLEVNRRILSQVPEILKKEEVPEPIPLPTTPEATPPPEVQPEERPEKTRKDIYREPIE